MYKSRVLHMALLKVQKLLKMLHKEIYILFIVISSITVLEVSIFAQSGFPPLAFGQN